MGNSIRHGALVSSFSIQNYNIYLFVVNSLTVRARKHLKRKKEVMKDLIFIWESQKLKLFDTLNQPQFSKLVSPYVKYHIREFKEAVRDRILDIIYNSQLNYFVIKKFNMMKDREDWKRRHAQKMDRRRQALLPSSKHTSLGDQLKDLVKLQKILNTNGENSNRKKSTNNRDNLIKDYVFNPSELQSMVTKRIGYEDFTHAVQKMNEALKLVKKMEATKTVRKGSKRLRKTSSVVDDSLQSNRISKAKNKRGKLRKSKSTLI